MIPSNGCVRVSTKQEAQTIQVTVQDTSPGMNEETRKHISDQYFQGNTPQAVLGNSLGLTLVKRILDKISNTITVSNTPGEGSTFTVALYP